MRHFFKKFPGASAPHHQCVRTYLVGAGDETDESTLAEVWALDERNGLRRPAKAVQTVVAASREARQGAKRSEAPGTSLPRSTGAGCSTFWCWVLAQLAQVVKSG